jgi:hypothetical protein
MAGVDNLTGQGFDAHPERMNHNGRPKGSRNRQTIMLKK